MHPLAEIEEIGEAVSFTTAETRRIREFKIPGDRNYNQDPRFYARRPKENVAQWHADYWDKLRGLERAAGMGRGSR